MKGSDMRDNFNGEQWIDDEGRPAGGVNYGTGFCISWQNGPLGRGEDHRRPNGAFVETQDRAERVPCDELGASILAVVASRIEFYNVAGFKCDENDRALEHIYAALDALKGRTARPEAEGVEGTHSGS